MASLKPVSFDPIAPDLVEDRWIGFDDGLETTPACSSDAVVIGVPKDTRLPVNSKCISSPHATTGEKIKEWLKSIVH
jgi:hypothetical protein